MTFPWVFANNFQAGTNAGYDTEGDTAGQLDIAHYSELARYPWPHAAPYSGAYSLRCVLSGGTSDAILTEGDIDITADANRFLKFDMYISPTFDATADDTINIVELRASGTAEVTFGFRYVAATDVINFGIGETAPTSFGSASIEKGVWYTIELDVSLDAGTQDDGSIDLYVTKTGDPAATVVHASQVGSLNQGAVTEGVIGVQDHLATTTGVLLFNNIVFDDTRVYPGKRYTETVRLTHDDFAFVGGGWVEQIDLIGAGAADATCHVYDADVAADLNTMSPVAIIKTDTAEQMVQYVPPQKIQFRKGCYLDLGGTNPQAVVHISKAPLSDAGVRHVGLHRR